MSKPEKKPETQNETTVEQDNLFADTNISMKSGRLVKDAELIAEGKFIRMRIATNKQYESDGEVKDLVNYFNILVSKNLTDAFNTSKDLEKGDWVYIKGEDNSKSFDTVEGYKQDAVTTFAYKVVKKKDVDEQEEAPAMTDVLQP